MVFSSPYRRKALTAENTYNIMFDKVYHFKDNMRLLTDKFELDKIPKNGRQCNFNSTGSVMPENFQVQILAVSDSTASPHPLSPKCPQLVHQPSPLVLKLVAPLPHARASCPAWSKLSRTAFYNPACRQPQSTLSARREASCDGSSHPEASSCRMPLDCRQQTSHLRPG